MSGACLLIGATTTHGLGGELHHSGYPGFTEGQPSWRFFQPFQCDCCMFPCATWQGTYSHVSYLPDCHLYLCHDVSAYGMDINRACYCLMIGMLPCCSGAALVNEPNILCLTVRLIDHLAQYDRAAWHF